MNFKNYIEKFDYFTQVDAKYLNKVFKNTALRKSLKELETMRREGKKTYVKKIAVLLVSSFGLFLFGVVNQSNIFAIFSYIAPFVGVFGSIIIYREIYGTISEKLQKEFMPLFISNITPNVSHHHAINLFDESAEDLVNKHILKKFDRVTTTDSVAIEFPTLPNVSAQGAEFHTEQKYYDKKERRSKYIPLENVFILRVDFHKGLHTVGSELDVLRTRRSKKKRLKLENIEFEKLYDSYSDDHLEARMMLTPAAMQRIVEFTSAIEKNRVYDFYFREKSLYISYSAFKTFELEISESFTHEREQYVRFYLEIKNMMNLVSQLNLYYYDREAYSKQSALDYKEEFDPLWIFTGRRK